MGCVWDIMGAPATVLIVWYLVNCRSYGRVSMVGLYARLLTDTEVWYTNVIFL